MTTPASDDPGTSVPGATSSSSPGQPHEEPDRKEASHGTPDHETLADVAAERAILARAIGGWRGVIDSGLPSAVFVTVYLVSGSQLAVALWSSIAVAVAVAVLRLVRRESLQQTIAGLVGVGISAFVASRTGRAEDFFLPFMLVNLAYGCAFLISILVRWPLIGVVVGILTGMGTSWRRDVTLRRVFAAASWLWVGVFFLRLAVQTPLWLAAWVGPLGVARIVLGWPLFLLAAYVTYLVLKQPLAQARERRQRPRADGPPDDGSGPVTTS